MPWARASELDRVLACDGSTFLPRSEMRSDRTIEAGDWGTMVHHWSATGEIRPCGGRNTHTARFQDRLDASGVERLTWWPELEGSQHELSVAYEALTGELHVEHFPTKPKEDEWKMSFGPTWVVGTMDYTATLLGSPWVDDLKTGRWPTPVTSAQITFYALCIARWKGSDTVRASITHWPRYPVIGQPSREARVLEFNDLEDFAELLETRVRRGRGPLTTGDQCRFCPSRAFCSAYLAIEALKDNAYQDRNPQEGKLLDPQHLLHRRPPDQGPGAGDVRGERQDDQAPQVDVPGRDPE